jgi:hypothetical protein
MTDSCTSTGKVDNHSKVASSRPQVLQNIVSFARASSGSHLGVCLELVRELWSRGVLAREFLLGAGKSVAIEAMDASPVAFQKAAKSPVGLAGWLP